MTASLFSNRTGASALVQQTALWSSLQKVAHDERMPVPTPAHITEAASRYLLTEGRSLPSEGLTIEQVCEGIRGAGLQPLVIRSVSPEEDRAALVTCVRSGFPPVLAIQPLSGGSWHAICAVESKWVIPIFLLLQLIIRTTHAFRMHSQGPVRSRRPTWPIRIRRTLPLDTRGEWADAHSYWSSDQVAR